jgi:hypothetical protein
MSNKEYRMMKGSRSERHFYPLSLGNLKCSILNDQCSMFKEEKRTKIGRIR